MDPSALEQLWKNKAFAALLELSSATLKTAGMDGTPALLFEGVGLYETGRHEEGIQRIHRYFAEQSQSWTMNFTAIALHYFALDTLRKGRRDEGVEGMKRAFDYYALDQTADALKELTEPLELDRSPFILALDCAGTIVYEGDLGSVDLWDTLASISV